MPNYDTMLMGLRDLIDNPTPRVPVALCLDVSSSMSGKPIEELNTGVQQYIQEILKDSLTRYSAETAVVSFASEAVCEADFDTAEHMQIDKLEADGYTYMGEGLTLALDLLDKRKKQYHTTGVDYYQPILVVMSDGAPNGDPSILQEAIQRIYAQVQAKRLTVIAVGVGHNVDMDMLAKISPKQAPFQIHGLQFREFFAWLSQSVSSVSASIPDDETALDIEALAALAAEPWPDNFL